MKKHSLSLQKQFRRHLFIGLMCIATLSACTLKSLYLQLDWIIPTFIEDYIPLNDKQENDLEISLLNTLNWHRSSQLPEYTRWLKLFRQDITRGLSQKKILQHSQQLEQHWKTLLTHLADDFALLLVSTDQEQRKHLFDTFKEKNRDYQEKYIEQEEDTLRKELSERIKNQYERWSGDIEPEQLILIQKAANELKLIGELRLASRRNWQQQLKSIIESTHSLTELKPAIKNLFSYPEKLWPKEYQLAIDHNRAVLVKLTVDLSNTLSEEQKNHLFKKIDYYINLFNELSIKK